MKVGKYEIVPRQVLKIGSWPLVKFVIKRKSIWLSKKKFSKLKKKKNIFTYKIKGILKNQGIIKVGPCMS